VAFSPGTTEITNSHATLSGGKMYAISEQKADKDLIGKQGSTFMFCMTNNNTYFKIELEKAIAVGDVFSAETYSRTDTNLGLFISTSTTRPNECSTKLSIAKVATAAYEPLSSYTVQEGDGLAGATELYIYRETGNSTYFNEFKITREATTPIPTNYLVDFNTEIATSSHDFKLASNWGHIVGSGNYDGYGPYYMSYSYKADEGFNGTGTLIAYRQYAGDSSGGETCYDLLVTPLVSGTITMKVKAHTNASSSNPSFVEIYETDETGTTRGDIIQKFTVDEGYADIEGQTEWKQISLTLAEEQRIAIRAQYVYLDDFTAESANIIPQKALSVIKVMNMDGNDGTAGTTTYFEQQADNTLLVPLKVALTNTGDVDLVAGSTENYTLTLASASYASGAKTYYEDATVSVPVSLAAGASETVEVRFSIPYTSGWKYFFIRENIIF
jgi:membrane-bound inhibitor of C-type lysozyme